MLGVRDSERQGLFDKRIAVLGYVYEERSGNGSGVGAGYGEYGGGLVLLQWMQVGGTSVIDDS
jgi:hypothetical protein